MNTENPTSIEISRLTEAEAREFIESILWPNGPVCPHCGNTEAYKIEAKSAKTQVGLYKCKACRKKFTVTVGTIFEDSRIPLHKWLIAIYRMCASKKGVSAHQLHRELGITYKSAWFMCHRIRYGMSQEPLSSMLSGTVEADETFVGGLEKNKHQSKRTAGTQGRSTKTKTPVAILVERDGRARATKVEDTSGKTLKANIRQNVDPSANMMTDEWTGYTGLATEYTSHQTVDHGKEEFVRGDVYTNTAESWIALFKRGIMGTFHHISETHMNRYADEFSFRWDNRKAKDGQRAVSALKGVKGKRLRYKDTTRGEA
jgi:transposase-like protein